MGGSGAGARFRLTGADGLVGAVDVVRGAIAESTVVLPVADTPVDIVPSVLTVVLAVSLDTAVFAGSLALVAAVEDKELLTAVESMLGTKYLIA